MKKDSPDYFDSVETASQAPSLGHLKRGRMNNGYEWFKRVGRGTVGLRGA